MNHFSSGDGGLLFGSIGAEQCDGGPVPKRLCMGQSIANVIENDSRKAAKEDRAEK